MEGADWLCAGIEMTISTLIDSQRKLPATENVQ
jgi:hypothetical protein